MKTTHAENYSWLGKEGYLWKYKGQLKVKSGGACLFSHLMRLQEK